MITGIKHIIFDLGGVLLNLDQQLTIQAFADLGIADIRERYAQFEQATLFDSLETGAITAADFIGSLRSAAGDQCSDEQIVAAWNKLILDFPLRRLQILQQLQLHYDLVLLSNTNEIHEPFFNNVLQQAHGIPNIGVFFDKVYYSHRMGLRKPDARIYARVLEDCGFKPEETLFIDDNEHNIKAAEALGIQVIWLKQGMTIEDDIFLQLAD